MPSSLRLCGRPQRGRLQKIRHLVRADDGHQIEVDVYGGALSGLIVAEVEFDDPWGAEIFVVPYWFGSRSLRTRPTKISAWRWPAALAGLSAQLVS